MQRFIQTITLRDTAEALDAYRRAHDNIWPEITRGIRSVGIRTMDLYLLGNRAVMLLEVPDGVDVDEAFRTLAELPRQAEWEEFVAQWQQCDPGASSAQKWTPMEKIFSLPE